MLMQLHEQTARLITYLQKVPVGSIISYGELSAQCEWDPGSKHLLLSAIQILYRQGIQFRSVRGVGYERLDPNSGVKHIRRYHNARAMRDTERMGSKINGVNPANLARDGRYQFQQAQTELVVRQRAEQQFAQDSLDERVARRRLREQEERRKLEEANRLKILEEAKKHGWG